MYFLPLLQFDLDGNGYITTEELGEALQSVDIVMPGYELRNLMKTLDKDNDKRINLSEFFGVSL